MHSKALWWLSVLMVVAMMASACSSPAAPAPAQAPAQPTQAPAVSEGQAAPTAEQPAAGAAEGKKKIGITLYTRQHQFYQTMEKTWKDNADKYGYELLIQNAETDPAVQTAQVEDFIQQKVDAIVLHAVDPKGMIPAVEDANKAGIPVVTVDGPVSGGKTVTFIGTDNFGGGRLAGEYAKQYITEKLGGKANVAILDYPQSAVVCVARVNGFKSALEGMPDVKVVAQQDGGAMRDKAMGVFENVLSANPKIDVVFGINDDTILGAMAAAESAGRDKDMVFIGYDGTPEAAKLILDGKSTLMADIAQQPVKIAEKAMEVVQGAMAGKSYDPETPVAPILITKDNAAEFAK